MKHALSIAAASLIVTTIGTAGRARADEGMWTFDAFPAPRMQAAYGWAPDQEWLTRAQAAAVRLTGGCSASFVSPEGLILTNHHCVVSCAQDLSTQREDLVAAGFVAADRSRERTCPGQQAEVVTQIDDVTAQVTQAIGTATGEALVRARDAVTTQIAQAGCPDTATTRCQVVTLFGGAQYKLYRYRRYADVRLVWAPEISAAFFGGDPDNFNFPRYAIDAAFLRAYENGRPVATPAHLRWNPRAPEAGEATFVVGNPGSTQRLLTEQQRATRRELFLPLRVTLLSEYRGRLVSAMGTDPVRVREGTDTLFGVENSYKVFWGQQRALLDPGFTATLAKQEADLRARTRANGRERAAVGDPWADIATADARVRDLYYDYYFLEAGAGQGSSLYGYARTLVRAAAEREKPSAERRPGFGDAALPLLERQLAESIPVYPWLEELTIAFWLSKTREYLTADSPRVRQLLGLDSPETLAQRAVKGTRLADPKVRARLFHGGMAAIRASDDPMIRLALANEEIAGPLIAQWSAEVDGPLSAAQSRLGRARFAAYGDANYPDATFTLRISYGRVQGWTERGRAVPHATQLGGLYQRATGQEPFRLAQGYARARERLDPATAFNFVTTNDIIGGNSGSPVIARDGSVIGAAFDGNIHSLGGNFGYDPELNRTVVVSTAAIQQALEQVYPAPRLVAELRGRR